MGRVKDRIRSGLSWGMYFALVFSGLATVLVLVSGGSLRDEYNLTYVQLIGTYLVGGALGGLMVGLLLPFCRHPLGAMVTGFVGALPFCFLITFAMLPRGEWERLMPVAPLVAAAILGPFGALAVWTALKNRGPL